MSLSCPPTSLWDPLDFSLIRPRRRTPSFPTYDYPRETSDSILCIVVESLSQNRPQDKKVIALKELKESIQSYERVIEIKLNPMIH